MQGLPYEWAAPRFFEASGASAEHEERDRGGADHGGGGAADDELANAGVAVRPHEQELSLVVGELVGDDLLGVTRERKRGDGGSGSAKAVSGVPKFFGGSGILVTHGEQNAIETFEQGIGGGEIQRLQGAGAAIKSEEIALDGIAGGGNHQDGVVAAADHAFDIG